MDHRWRGVKRGLIVLEDIPTRCILEEEEILIDSYASEGIDRHVPFTIHTELDGWARSFYTLDTHLRAILNYDRPKLPQPSDDAWIKTMHFVRQQFRKMDKVTTLSYRQLDTVKWVRSSAAGFGYKGLKSDPGNYERARKIAFTIAERLNHDRSYAPGALEDSTPDVTFTRTQLSQIKVKRKVRNVRGEAFHYVLLEGLFADPLIQYFMRANTFYFIGHDPLLAVPLLVEDTLSEFDYVYVFDWSGFDSSVHEWEIRFAFSLLETMLEFPSTVELHVWRFVIELFIYRKIASPNGVLYLKTQGIPSGSCFTNIIGSITNYVRIQYMFQRLTNSFACVYTHGDDSLAGVSASQFIPISNIATLCQEYNWMLNIDKSGVSESEEAISFLSRTVRVRQHTRDELTCLRMLKFPEYAVESGAISTLRALSICKDAGINSQYLYQVYKFLSIKYGKADSLPFHHKNWDPLEYESLRLPFSN